MSSWLAWLVTQTSEIEPVMREAFAVARSGRPGPVHFRVEQENSVYPMVPTGAALHQMVECSSSIAETAAD